jgi:hypothetical protein
MCSRQRTPDKRTSMRGRHAQSGGHLQTSWWRALLLDERERARFAIGHGRYKLKATGLLAGGIADQQSGARGLPEIGQHAVAALHPDGEHDLTRLRQHKSEDLLTLDHAGDLQRLVRRFRATSHQHGSTAGEKHPGQASHRDIALIGLLSRLEARCGGLAVKIATAQDPTLAPRGTARSRLPILVPSLG